MIFNEKEMLEVCQKYGIDVIEKDGYPIYRGNEMTDDFSMDDIMHDTYGISIDEKTIYSKTLEWEMSVVFENNDLINCYINSVDKQYFINIDNDEYYKSVKPSKISNNNISLAA